MYLSGFEWHKIKWNDASYLKKIPLIRGTLYFENIKIKRPSFLFFFLFE